MARRYAHLRETSACPTDDSQAFVESLGEPAKRRARSSKRRLRDAIEDLARVFPKGEPADDFAPRHLVALYAKLHEQVYGAAPGELEEGASFLAASSSAEKLVRASFGGSTREAIEFLRWTWRRERNVVKRRREDGATGRRIGWRLQFASAALLTDYRVDLAQRSERGPRPAARA